MRCDLYHILSVLQGGAKFLRFFKRYDICSDEGEGAAGDNSRCQSFSQKGKCPKKGGDRLNKESHGGDDRRAVFDGILV